MGQCETKSLYGTLLVTGGLGFIGSHFIDYVLSQKLVSDIVIVDVETYAASSVARQKFGADKRVRLIKRDICDIGLLHELGRCDMLVHFAAETHVPSSFDQAELFHKTNSLGTRRLLDWARQKGVPRFVHISTDEVYGPVLGFVDENHPFNPTSPYAKSKVEAERAVGLARSNGLDVIVIRPTNAIGVGQHHEKVAPRFIGRALANKPLLIEGDGTQTRSFLPVSDLVEAIWLAAQSGTANSTYNVPGNEVVSINELAKIIIEVTRSSSAIEYVDNRPVNDEAYELSGDRIRQLGYSQKSSVRQELIKIAEDLTCQTIEYSPSLAPDLDDEVKIPFHIPFVARSQEAEIANVIKCGRFRYGGTASVKAQKRIAELTGALRVELTNSCTSAMEVAALALDLSPSDEVIIPSYTFVATVNAFARTGAKIVFCDVSPDTMMIDIAALKKCISPRTKAVVVVHYGGNCVDVPAVRQVLGSSGIAIIEDAAQAFLVTRDGEVAGTMGDFGAFSFHETKVVHSGQGGALLVNRKCPDLNNRVTEILDRGTDHAAFLNGQKTHYEWTGMGFSARPTELDCAVLSAQISEYQTIQRKRALIYDLYAKSFNNSKVQFIPISPATKSNYHSFVLILDNAITAGNLVHYANLRGVGLQSHYVPLHLSEKGRNLGWQSADCAVAANMWDRLVRLPIYPDLAMSEVERIIELVFEFYDSLNSGSSFSQRFIEQTAE